MKKIKKIKKKDCFFCDPKEKKELIKKLFLAEKGSWRAELSIDHSYLLGRCIIVFHDHSKEEFFDIGKDDLTDLFDITKLLRNTITDLFGAYMFNYEILMNATKHLHMHLTPRYRKDVEFDDTTFVDENWGDRYKVSDRIIPEDILIEIADEIKKGIEKKKK
jgi:diadenosine tetraphosphate (Ap4A) HIT family hydrolase